MNETTQKEVADINNRLDQAKKIMDKKMVENHKKLEERRK